MLHSSLQFQSISNKGNVNNLECLVTAVKYFASRKWGSIVRLSAIFLIIFGIYLTSYVLFDKGPKFQEVNNETGTSGQISVVSHERSKAMHHVTIPDEVVVVPSTIQVGDVVLSCGLQTPCNRQEFSVHIYTGKDHKDEPRLCIDGKYILSKDVNGGGRGINVVVVDNMTRNVIKVSHFDTYEKESTALETLLLTLRPGDIVILLTFDEPTRKLSRVARLLLHELGSALIQNLSYRGSWYLVTQKGLTGFSPFEELHLVQAYGWSKQHDVRFCVPFQIKGQLIHPDPHPRQNQPRLEFCQKHNSYPLFCDADVVNDPLSPAPVAKHATSTSKIYGVPVLVMSGENIQYLPLTLETLIRQPGINPSIVVVYYLPQHLEVPSLSDLFGFMSEELTPTANYCERVIEAYETGNLLFPDAKEMILLGESIVLAPDFLFYMGQLLSLLAMDSSISSISAWNENGFKGVSGDPSIVYREESFSSLAVLVRRNFFQKAWCKNDSKNDPLFITADFEGENIVPDVSRVLPVLFESAADSDNSLFSAIFAHDRVTSFDENTGLKSMEKLYHENYEKLMDTLLTSATPLTLDITSLLHCADQKEDNFDGKGIADLLPLMNANVTSQVLVIYYKQADSSDVAVLQLLCRCFGLFYHPEYSPRGLYRGMLRFTWNSNPVFLVGSASPFYRHKLAHIRPLTLDAGVSRYG